MLTKMQQELMKQFTTMINTPDLTPAQARKHRATANYAHVFNRSIDTQRRAGEKTPNAK